MIGSQTRKMTPRIGMAIVALFFVHGASAQPLFGDAKSVAYAQALWAAMVENHFAGKDPISAVPYIGLRPHGKVLETIEGPLTVNGYRGLLVVKRNYGGYGVSRAAVADDPTRFLQTVTVMFRREEGYNPKHGNWFFVKYLPDGSLASDPNDVHVAGRVGMGKRKGCIPCHQSAPGGDYLFNHNRYAEEEPPPVGR